MTDPRVLDGARLRALLGPEPLWIDAQAVGSTGSTNADLADLGAGGAAEGTVLATTNQTAGRGRLARTWVSPSGAGIAVSMLLRPQAVPRERWSWLPLVAGIAVADALAEMGVAARLKWPNDVLVEDRKIAGILVEVADRGRAVIVGIGVNLSRSSADLPSAAATSIGLELGATVDAPVDATATLATLLRHVARWYDLWRTAEAGTSTNGAGASTVAAAYVERSATLGRPVEITLPSGGVHRGAATGIDANGALIVTNAAGPTTFHAGDVTHVR